MGLFDFLKKKTVEAPKATQPLNNNTFALETLQQRLITMGYDAERHPQYLALIVNSDLEIATVIIENPGSHPDLLQLMIATIHPTYFPEGIIENVMGLGKTPEEKINSALDNYLNTTFLTIMDSFSEIHDHDLDFTTVIDNKEILWHPKLGNIGLQGVWKSTLQDDTLYRSLVEKIKSKLSLQKFNWLKIYIAKLPNGETSGECLFNNDPWKEGLEIISNQAKTWTEESEFVGQKQFVMFRRCDAYDE